jgi:tetratricopeptide (TPR) repeat protein
MRKRIEEKIMNSVQSLSAGVLFIFAIFLGGAQLAAGQIPNQLAQDFVAGSAPKQEEVTQLEKDVTANPGDARLVRKLGKAYFFQFFGEGNMASLPKAEKTLDRALALAKDDPETLAYLGALQVLRGQRVEKGNSAKQKASYDRGFEMMKLAEKLDPRHGAVVAIASASYLWLPESYGMAPHVVDMLEGLRKGMGPYFKKFSDHGQQRLLLTLGQAYVRVGERGKAIPLFEEALAVNTASHEADYLRAELKKLGK